MRRLEIARYGPIRASVRFADVPAPHVGEHDVLVEVRAASVNPIDFKIAAGQLTWCGPPFETVARDRLNVVHGPAPYAFEIADEARYVLNHLIFQFVLVGDLRCALRVV